MRRTIGIVSMGRVQVEQLGTMRVGKAWRDSRLLEALERATAAGMGGRCRFASHCFREEAGAYL